MKTISSSRILIIILAIVSLSGCGKRSAAPGSDFDGEVALDFVAQQMAFGPRIPGSEGHLLTRQWIVDMLADHGWETEVQKGEYQGKPIYNIVGYRSKNLDPGDVQHIIIGAHYDTRIYADYSQNPDDRLVPVPGANDGASGVAVLLELSRVLEEFEHLDVQFVFFDAEDNGKIPGWDWIIGSELFAESLDYRPDAVVIVDMIGDSEQEIYFEKSSDPFLQAEIWNIATELEINVFIPEEKHHILDDHTPFLRRGITAVDIIDFDYPYWHTAADTLDKVSSSSLENVGSVLQGWLAYRESFSE